ncbi:MAG: C40 family peptidase, partial [Acidimicrobiia bacterium]
LPHSSRAQYGATKRVSKGDLQPGDLVFFGSPIHHVGLYIGNGNMINAPETGEYVGIRPAFRRDYVGAGRPGV